MAKGRGLRALNDVRALLQSDITQHTKRLVAAEQALKSLDELNIALTSFIEHFGIEVPEAPVVVVKRGPGRPPGSKTKAKAKHSPGRRRSSTFAPQEQKLVECLKAAPPGDFVSGEEIVQAVGLKQLAYVGAVVSRIRELGVEVESALALRHAGVALPESAKGYRIKAGSYVAAQLS